MRTPKSEQETTISAYGDEDTFLVYSSITSTVKKLELLAKSWGCAPVYPHKGGIKLRLPLKAFGFRKLRKERSVKTVPPTRTVKDA